MRKFFKKAVKFIGDKIASFARNLKQAAGRAVAAIGRRLQMASIALSGAAPTMGWLGGTIAAVCLGMPLTAMTFATFTTLALYGTIMYCDAAEHRRLYDYLFIMDAAGKIASVGIEANNIRSHRRARRVVLSGREF